MLERVPNRLDYHEMLIGRVFKILLNNVPGALNVVTFHHLIRHKAAPRRLGQSNPPEVARGVRTERGIGNPFTPRERTKDQHSQLRAEGVLCRLR